MRRNGYRFRWCYTCDRFHWLRVLSYRRWRGLLRCDATDALRGDVP